MQEARAGDLSKDSTRISRQPFRQRSARFAVEWAPRVQEVGTIKDSAHHVPLGQADGVIADRIEHTSVNLALRLGLCGAGRSMPELRRSRCGGGPPGQLVRRRVPQRIMEPDRAKPAISFRVRHSDLLRPTGGELSHALNVVDSFRCDDGPLGQRGPQFWRRPARRKRRVRFVQRIPSPSLMLSMRRVPPIRAASDTTVC